MRRTSIARDVYGKPRHDTDDSQIGRKAKARNLRVSVLPMNEENYCSSCDRPRKLCPCEYLDGKRVAHPDSLMEAAIYKGKKSRVMFYRSVGRLA
jgi:ATP sulfurylase